MKKRILIGLVVLLIVILTAGILQAQPKGHGMMPEGSGPPQGKHPMSKGQCMMGHQSMMRGMGQSQMGMGMGYMHEIMGQFHAWIRSVMTHRYALSLSNDQVNQIEETLTAHLKNAIHNRAEARILKVDLINALRKKMLNLQKVEEMLKKRADLNVRLQMEGIKLYTEFLQILNEEQKAKLMEMLGSPFKAPWEGMSMPSPIEMQSESPAGGDESQMHHNSPVR